MGKGLRFALLAALLFVPAAQGAIIGAAGVGSVTFDDTAAGGGFYTTGPLPMPVAFGPIFDGGTGDSGGGSVSAAFGPFDFFVGVGGFVSSAAVGGAAVTTVDFSVDFFLDGGGLPATTVGGYFLLSGFVSPVPGSFVDFGAVATFTNSVLGPMEALGLGFTNAVPGPFAAFVFDVGAIPAQPGGSIMNLSGTVFMAADPADIMITQIVPEPGSIVLVGMGGLGLVFAGFRSRRNKVKKVTVG